MNNRTAAYSLKCLETILNNPRTVILAEHKEIAAKAIAHLRSINLERKEIASMALQGLLARDVNFSEPRDVQCANAVAYADTLIEALNEEASND